MSEPVAVEIVVMKDASDCGVCALAMLLGQPYVEVYRAAEALSPQCSRRGLWNTELTRIARKLGAVLSIVKPVPHDLSEATWILAVQKPKQAHYVMLFEGVILNPADGLAWNVDAFLARGKWRKQSLIVRAESA